PPRVALARAVEVFTRRALAGPTLAYALMAEPADPAVERARIDSKRDYRATFAELLRRGVASGDWPPLDVDTAAAAIVGTLQESLLSPLAAHQPADAIVAGLTTFITNAVRSIDVDDRASQSQHA